MFCTGVQRKPIVVKELHIAPAVIPERFNRESMAINIWIPGKVCAQLDWLVFEDDGYVCHSSIIHDAI